MKPGPTPDLNDLRLLIEIARSESFSAAADRLRLPPSTVSRRLQNLETALGTTLLLRSTRRVSLTDEGRQLLDAVGHHVEQIDRSMVGFHTPDAPTTGILRVATSFSFAHSLMPTILARYREMCPDVSVDVKTSHLNVDLIGESVDIAIRMGEPADSALVYRKLGQLKQSLYAAPSFCAEHPIVTPSDLMYVPLVAHRMRMRRDCTFWELFNTHETFVIERPPAVEVDDPILTERLVCAGAGVGLLSDILATESVAAGRLTPVLPDWSGALVSLYCLYHRQLGRVPKIQIFLNVVDDVLAKA